MVGTRYNVCGAEREKERERKRARHKGCCTEKERKRESKAQRVLYRKREKKREQGTKGAVRACEGREEGTCGTQRPCKQGDLAHTLRVALGHSPQACERCRRRLHRVRCGARALGRFFIARHGITASRRHDGTTTRHRDGATAQRPQAQCTHAARHAGVTRDAGVANGESASDNRPTPLAETNTFILILPPVSAWTLLRAHRCPRVGRPPAALTRPSTW